MFQQVLHVESVIAVLGEPRTLLSVDLTAGTTTQLSDDMRRAERHKRQKAAWMGNRGCESWLCDTSITSESLQYNVTLHYLF